VIPFSHWTVKVLFPLDATRRTPVVDMYSPWVLNKIELYGAYHFSGNALSFQGPSPVISGGSSPETGGSISFANDISIPEGNVTIEGGGQLPIIFSGELSGSGGIIATIPIILSGSNTMTGPIVAQTSSSALPYATIQVTNPAALGPASSAPVQVGGGRLELFGGITIAGKSLSLGTGPGSNEGLVSAGGANMWTGRIDLFRNSSVTTKTANDSLTLSGPIDAHYQSYLDVHGDGDILISGPISNLQQALDKYGNGTLILAGNNTFAGSLYLTKGTVILRGGNAIADQSAVLLEVYSPNSATLRLEANETIGSIRGQNSVIDLGTHTLRINQSYDLTYWGTFTGAGTVVKAGPAPLQFSTPTATRVARSSRPAF
jgi:autotransporter-associated beta strand protein